MPNQKSFGSISPSSQKPISDMSPSVFRSQSDLIRSQSDVSVFFFFAFSLFLLREAQAFAEDPESSWEQIEAEQLQGQKLQGPSTCIDAPTTELTQRVVFSFFSCWFFSFSLFRKHEDKCRYPILKCSDI